MFIAPPPAESPKAHLWAKRYSTPKEFVIANASLFYKHLATTWLWRARLLELRFIGHRPGATHLIIKRSKNWEERLGCTYSEG